MALQIDIVNISAATYPIDVYVCSGCPSESCVLVDTISSVPELITIPAPYDTYDSFAVKIVGSNGCEICETFENVTPSICDTCNIGFNFYDTNPIGVISVGIITGSCDTNITDYVIEWYGPGPNSTNVSFTSGLGSEYLGEYLYTQPLTGTSQIPVLAGVYTPVIAKIKINGVEYFNLRCFDSVTVLVDPLTCDNGVTSTLPQYDHKIRFLTSVNQTPQPVATTFILDPTNPYFAFRFEGEAIFDTLEIKFIGSSYSDPIIIESISQGVNLDGTDFSLSLVPKKAKTYSYVQPSRNNFSKVLNLSNFDINVDDYLEIKITPNTGNTNTNWSFYCKCLENFNCNICDDLNITSPYRIIQSTIQNTLNGCFGRRVRFNLSGCTDSDIKRYMMTDSACCDAGVDNANTVWFQNVYTFLNFDVSVNYTPIFSCGAGGFINTPPCAPFSTSTITYNKSVVGSEGLLSMTFSSYDDFLVYWNNWQTNYITYSGNPSNCSDFLGYYRYFNLRIPKSQGSEQCGDSTVFNDYQIHPSSIVTSGGTGPWNMSITMKTITNCFTFSGCNSACTDSLNTFFVNPINNSATGTSNNYTGTTNTGSRLVTPISTFLSSNSGSTIEPVFQGTADIYIPKYINETIPYSGTPLTIIPSLSAQTCNFSTWGLNPGYTSPSKNLSFYTNKSFFYQVRLINPSNEDDFELWTLIPSLQKIYQYSGGSVNFINSSYFV